MAKRLTPQNSSYREQALKILPWLCARCAREQTGTTPPPLSISTQH